MALNNGECSYKCVKQILQRGLDSQPGEPQQACLQGPVEHGNIRGPEYFRSGAEEARGAEEISAC